MRFRAPFLFGRPIGLVLLAFHEVFSGFIDLGIGFLGLIAGYLIAGELSEDPGDIFLHWLLNQTPFTLDASHRIGLLFFLYGLVKVSLGVGMWTRSWKVRRVMIAFFFFVIPISFADLMIHFSYLKLIAFFIDMIIFWYVSFVFPHHLSKQDEVRA